MRYTEIIIYRRGVDGTSVGAYRQSIGHGYMTTKRLNIADMYRGHCAWIAEQINPNQARRAA